MVQSTRSTYTVTDTEAVLTGIAPDGGLFTDPELGTERKKLSPAELKAYAALSYPETAKKIQICLHRSNNFDPAFNLLSEIINQSGLKRRKAEVKRRLTLKSSFTKVQNGS